MKPNRKAWVRVGRPYFLSNVYEDRWSQIYPGPWRVEGYHGWVARGQWIMMNRFRNFRVDAALISEVLSNPAIRVLAHSSQEQWKKHVMEPIEREISTIIRSNPECSMLWQVNLLDDPWAPEHESGWIRSFVAFGDPNAGCRPMSWFAAHVRPVALRATAWLLNKFDKRGRLRRRRRHDELQC